MFKSSITLYITVPKSQQVKYIPGVLQTLKYAWVQYIAIFIPLLYVYWAFIGFMFKYQVLETSITSDIV